MGVRVDSGACGFSHSEDNKYLFLFSVMQAQQISVFCCWLVHVLQTVISISKKGLYSKAAGTGVAVSVTCEEVVFLCSLWYDCVMTPEVYVLNLERCLGDNPFKVSFWGWKMKKNPTKMEVAWVQPTSHRGEAVPSWLVRWYVYSHRGGGFCHLCARNSFLWVAKVYRELVPFLPSQTKSWIEMMKYILFLLY